MDSMALLFFFFFFLIYFWILRSFTLLLFFYQGRRTPNQDSIKGVPVDYGRWLLLRIVGTALWMEI